MAPWPGLAPTENCPQWSTISLLSAPAPARTHWPCPGWAGKRGSGSAKTLVNNFPRYIIKDNSLHMVLKAFSIDRIQI